MERGMGSAQRRRGTEGTGSWIVRKSLQPNTMADRRLSLHSELYVPSPAWKPATLRHTDAEDMTSICLSFSV